MKKRRRRKIAQQIIDKDKWWDMLSRFIDVLRINIFVVDTQGLFILPPDRARFGGRLLTERRLGFDLLRDPASLMEHFEASDSFLEAKNNYGLSSFAIPIRTPDKKTIAYMIVGPVIIKKRLEREEYEGMARKQEANPEEVIGEINELRIVSNMMIRSILDLLSEIMRDHVDMSMREKELEHFKVEDDVPQSRDFEEVAKELYSSVCLDELLVTLLDVALKMTNAECGSIMISDKDKGVLTVRASRGLESEKLENVQVRLGEGIAGIAAQDNEPFVIKGTEGDNRIKHLLKRPDIKESLVIPLQTKDHVYGVLNLSNKTQEGHIEESLESLRYLTTLVSSAF